jgi:hypothetical protein
MAIEKKPRNSPKRPIKIPFVFIYVNLTSALAALESKASALAAAFESQTFEGHIPI